jgi:hypothetical protein
MQRPQPTSTRLQYVCLDLGYDNPTGQLVWLGMVISRICAALAQRNWAWQSANPHSHAEVGGRADAGMSSKCRALLIRYDKRAASFLGHLQ